jgi:hypothetical protein
MIRINLLGHTVPMSKIIEADTKLLFAIGAQREQARMTFPSRGRKSCFGDRKNRPSRTFEHVEALEQNVLFMQAAALLAVPVKTPVTEVQEGDQPTATPEAGAPIFGAGDEQ